MRLGKASKQVEGSTLNSVNETAASKSENTRQRLQEQLLATPTILSLQHFLNFELWTYCQQVLYNCKTLLATLSLALCPAIGHYSCFAQEAGIDKQRYTEVKMSVVGVDFGTLNTVIAVARNRGVDVVCIFSQPAKNGYVLI